MTPSGASAFEGAINAGTVQELQLPVPSAPAGTRWDVVRITAPITLDDFRHREQAATRRCAQRDIPDAREIWDNPLNTSARYRALMGVDGRSGPEARREFATSDAWERNPGMATLPAGVDVWLPWSDRDLRYVHIPGGGALTTLLEAPTNELVRELSECTRLLNVALGDLRAGERSLSQLLAQSAWIVEILEALVDNHRACPATYQTSLIAVRASAPPVAATEARLRLAEEFHAQLVARTSVDNAVDQVLPDQAERRDRFAELIVAILRNENFNRFVQQQSRAFFAGSADARHGDPRETLDTIADAISALMNSDSPRAHQYLIDVLGETVEHERDLPTSQPSAPGLSAAATAYAHTLAAASRNRTAGATGLYIRRGEKLVSNLVRLRVAHRILGIGPITGSLHDSFRALVVAHGMPASQASSLWDRMVGASTQVAAVAGSTTPEATRAQRIFATMSTIWSTGRIPSSAQASNPVRSAAGTIADPPAGSDSLRQLKGLVLVGALLSFAAAINDADRRANVQNMVNAAGASATLGAAAAEYVLAATTGPTAATRAIWGTRINRLKSISALCTLVASVCKLWDVIGRTQGPDADRDGWDVGISLLNVGGAALLVVEAFAIGPFVWEAAVLGALMTALARVLDDMRHPGQSEPTYVQAAILRQLAAMAERGTGVPGWHRDGELMLRELMESSSGGSLRAAHAALERSVRAWDTYNYFVELGAVAATQRARRQLVDSRTVTGNIFDDLTVHVTSLGTPVAEMA